jgi:amino acid transporter
MVISKKQTLISVFFSFFALFLILGACPVKADSSLLESQTGINDIRAAYGDQDRDIRETIAKVINVALQFIGVIFLALLVYAGFKYMTAAGNEEEAKKAIALIRQAVIGLIIILMAWGITRYFIHQLNCTLHGVDCGFYRVF